MKKVLGIDIGGVILDFALSFKSGGVSDEGFMATPVVVDSIESIAELNKGVFKDNIYLVSKYSNDGPEGIRKWLHSQKFYERTGIPESHLYQCRERDGKAPIVKELGVTHFIDDRAEVMSHFADFVPNLYHFQSKLENRDEYSAKIPNLIFVNSWKELMPMLKDS